MRECVRVWGVSERGRGMGTLLECFVLVKGHFQQKRTIIVISDNMDVKLKLMVHVTIQIKVKVTVT